MDLLLSVFLTSFILLAASEVHYHLACLIQNFGDQGI